MPFNAKPEHYEPLENVVTLAEASRRWGKTRQSISYAIDLGNVAGIKCGRNTLVSVPSLIHWYGTPKKVACF